MRYVKHRREKVGECTICRRTRELTWNHIPPQVAGNIDPVMLVSAMTAISGHSQEDLRNSLKRVSQRQNRSDYDYSEGDKLDQIIWPFSVGISISEETRGANAHRRGRFHVCYTPFVGVGLILVRKTTV
jgi:hypothetical protein